METFCGKHRKTKNKCRPLSVTATASLVDEECNSGILPSLPSPVWWSKAWDSSPAPLPGGLRLKLQTSNVAVFTIPPSLHPTTPPVPTLSFPLPPDALCYSEVWCEEGGSEAGVLCVHGGEQHREGEVLGGHRAPRSASSRVPQRGLHAVRAREREVEFAVCKLCNARCAT